MKAYSYSKLESYAKCGEYFRLYYLDKTVPRPDTNTKHTVLGNIVHDIVELYYEQFIGGLQGPARTVQELCAEYWQQKLEALGLPHIAQALQQYSTGINSLYERASAEYTGTDSIRKGKGKFREYSSNPTMTSEWSDAYKALGLEQVLSFVNTASKQAAEAVMNDPSKGAESLKIWGRMSLAELYASSWAILGKFKDHFLGCQIEAVEFQLTGYDRDFNHTTNAVWLPSLTATAFTGYIDLIARDGHNRVYIVDHKTSKEPPSASKVAIWDQLLLYGWAYAQLHGSPPDFIAINHLRSGVLIPVPFVMADAEKAVRRKLQQINGIEKEVFVQQSPSDFSSSCIDKLTREPCPYLKHCHPDFWSAYTQEKYNGSNAQKA